jgi:hypothetical protein
LGSCCDAIHCIGPTRRRAICVSVAVFIELAERKAIALAGLSRTRSG